MQPASLNDVLSAVEQRTGRPVVARVYPGAWFVLAVALVLGLGSYAMKPEIGLFTWQIGNTDPVNYMGVNYHVYHVAAEQAIAGESFYGVSPAPAVGGYRYLYPPVSVLVFYPFTLVDWTTGYTILTLGSVLGGAVGTALVVQYVERLDVPLGWLDVVLVFSLFVCSIHVAATIYFGNINILLGVAFVAGFWALARERDTLAGAAFAVPALFKLFPALVGVWLLRDRRWLATAAAIATGLAGLAAGGLLFGPEVTVNYFTEVLAGRSGADAFVGGYPTDSRFYVTVQRPLSHLIWGVWPAAPYLLLPLGAVLVCGGVLAAFYRDLSGGRRRLFAMFATVVVALVVVPSFRLYAPLLFLPFVALLYTWQGTGLDRFLFLAGAVLFSLPVRPRHVVGAADSVPGPLSELVVAVGTFATVQLYAFGLLLAGCVLHLRRTGAA